MISLDTVTSTNDYAAQLVADGRLDRNGMTIVLAREQTQGRGRLDHTWVSVPGKSFIASVICIVNADTAKDPQVNGWLQMIAGAWSVIDALRETVMSANMDGSTTPGATPPCAANSSSNGPTTSSTKA